MRLICPSCGAQYDVPDDAIPEAGRDVQCSNCNHTWFQLHTTAAPIAEPAAPQPARKPLDPAVSDILRQEAAREQQLRTSASTAPRQTQDDTTPKPAVDAAQTRRRIAGLTEAEAAAEADVRVAPAPKPVRAVRVTPPPARPEQPRVMPARSAEAADADADVSVDTATAAGDSADDMPSMNDINTSLRTRAQAPESALTPAEEAEIITRRGFRRGFVFGLLIFAVLLGPYILADQIVATFPQSADAMANYSATLDAMRLSLNQRAGDLGDWIAEITAGASNSPPDQN